MSQMPNSPENSMKHPLKPWKHTKPTVLSPNFTKALLAISIFAALTFYYFTSRCQLFHDRVLTHTSYVTDSTDLPGEIETNISHILFGIGGSAKTWAQRRRYSELWWDPNSTRGFVWFDRDPNATGTGPGGPPHMVSGDTERFKYTCRGGSRSAVRIARIVKESFELGLENVRWFVMGDDDTVFFPKNLVTVLRKYDHRQMHYIGGISESAYQASLHSYAVAYGGAGFAISYPLAAELVQVLDGCIDRYAESYGSDIKIGACMNEIGVPVTKELGFHQMDIRGSPLGLLSAHPLAPLVSLHHLDYVDPLFPNATRVDSLEKLMRSYKSDPNRILQHTFYYDLTRNWSISVAWGYNVQLYPFWVRPKELSTPLQTFTTWNKANGMFTFSTRRYEPDPCQRPVIFYFDGVEKFGNGSMVTSYARVGDEHRRSCEKENYEATYLIKGFNVSSSLFDPRLWNKAPRRQLCEITSGSPDVVNLRIRVHNPMETA